MPLNNFVCSSCHKEFELFVNLSEMAIGVKCPYCQAEVGEARPDGSNKDQPDSAPCGTNKIT